MQRDPKIQKALRAYLAPLSKISVVNKLEGLFAPRSPTDLAPDFDTNSNRLQANRWHISQILAVHSTFSANQRIVRSVREAARAQKVCMNFGDLMDDIKSNVFDPTSKVLHLSTQALKTRKKALRMRALFSNAFMGALINYYGNGYSVRVPCEVLLIGVLHLSSLRGTSFGGTSSEFSRGYSFWGTIYQENPLNG
ncbi:hypothetical protein DFH07DRAFT_780921 [Mycena maculata]|uniref:Uncharacterized protein n=1 Tax=Mycena maculata TaxID=230809 RepID=A0AAD7I0K5_9AGAR|nr:hypothetical protein DFH07DRAFT_780921 [Mycena maculata]